MADPNVRHMKWWGWGHEDVSFSDADKPKLWPYLESELGEQDSNPIPPVKRLRSIQFHQFGQNAQPPSSS